MPVVAAVECRRQLPRRSDVSIIVEGMADVVGKLLMHARESQVSEALPSMSVKGAACRIAFRRCGAR